MASSASGYVSIPRCPVSFDGTNYGEFAAFMRIHMRGLRLWGVLTGEVPCPPHPTAPVPPTPPPVPQALADDAPQAAQEAARSAELAGDEAYGQHVLAYSETLGSYWDSLAAFTQWCDENANAATILSQSIQPQFVSEFMGLATVAEMWSHLRQLGILCIYLCCVRSMVFSRVTLLLMSSTPRVRRFGASLTPFAVLSVMRASVAGQYVQIWIFRGSMSDLGPLRYFLGLDVSSTSDGFYISQEKYIQVLLTRAALGDERTVETPMELNVRLRATDGDPLPDPTRYRHLVGSLVYLAVTLLTSPTRPTFRVSSCLLPLVSTIVISFVSSAIFVALSPVVFSFLVPAPYSSRPTQMLPGLVIHRIASLFLLTVFFLVVLSLLGRSRSRLQSLVRVSRLSCERWLS
ncbi:hypothetical protein QYE76_003963 [Lolium multiflorum]|uniref:Uncharacterized protein n=1 Tax=Lolium multiflorum TaxID=4521 RepID=A0AAD8RR21_LOLMU|nr:hypothetical protein QYE76_003963 [Lolium multiflorum]